MLLISADGYIRMTLAQLQTLELHHLITGLDEDAPAPAGDAALSTVITGYTEWITPGQPAITLGWDWQMELHGAQLGLRRLGEPRGNVMLLDGNQNDLGQQASARLLAILVDGLDWQPAALRHVRSRYDCAPATATD